MAKTHSLNLLNNSISYFREAVDYAQRDTENPGQWKFAITHAVQAMELAFKEYLRRKHPVFIWENIDRPGTGRADMDKAEKTVSLRLAIERLRNPAIGDIAISDDERKKIEKAIDLRNRLTHYEFEYEHDYIELKFAEIFSFMIFFYKAHLNLAPDDFIDDAQHQKIVSLVKARDELLKRGRAYIEDRGFDTVWECPNCTENMFIVDEQQCCVCHHKEDVVDCEHCGETILTSQVVDVTDYFDWDHDEGRTRVQNDYDLPHSACTECRFEIKEKIEDARRAQYYEDMAMDARAFI